MMTTHSFDPNARKLVQEHLDAVERALHALPGEERRHVLAEVETQIDDMLHERGSRAVDDVRAVLAKLDPPTSYVEADKRADPIETEAIRPQYVGFWPRAGAAMIDMILSSYIFGSLAAFAVAVILASAGHSMD